MRLQHYLFLTFLFCTFLEPKLYAQEGANCANAVLINVIPYSDPNTAVFPPDAVAPNTCSAGNNFRFDDGCSNSRSDAYDFYYTYTPARDICIDIQISTSTTNNVDSIAPAIFVTQGCPNPTNSICIAQKTPQNPRSGVQPPYVTTLKNVALYAGRTYYIVVSGLQRNDAVIGNATCFGFSTAITESAQCATTLGSGCEYVDNLPAIPFKKENESTCDRTDFITLGNSYGTYAPDHIYTFTTTETFCGTIILSTDAPNNYMVLYNRCPNSNFYAAPSAITTGHSNKPIIQRFEAGQPYYLLVTHDSTGTGQSCIGYDLEIKPITDSGKNCNLPIIVPELPFNQYNTNSCKMDDFDNVGGCNVLYQNGDEVVYTYDSPGNECIAINLTEYSSSNIAIYIFDRCPELPGAVCLASIAGGGVLYTRNRGYMLDYTIGAPQKLYIVISSQQRVDYHINIAHFSTIGTTCANPIRVSPLPFSEYNSTACKQDDFDGRGTCDTIQQQGHEAIYEYNSPGNECISISVKDMNIVGTVYLFDRCPEDTAAVCLASGSSSMGVNFKDYVTLDYTFSLPQQIYIVIANRYTDEKLDYNITIKNHNDKGSTCADAIAISSIPFEDVNSTYCKGDDFDGATACTTGTLANINGNEIVYTYTSSGNECVTLVVTELTGKYSALYVYDRCPTLAGARCLASDVRVNSTTDYELSVVTTAAQTLYIVLGCAQPDLNFDFKLQVFVGIADLSGALCSNAIPAAGLPFSASYKVQCKGKEYYASNCLSYYGMGNDMVISYTVPERKCVRIIAQLDNKGGIALMDTCQPRAALNRCLASALCESACDSVVIEQTLDPGTYYIVIATYLNVYDLSVTLKIVENGKPSDGPADCINCDDRICVDCLNSGVEDGTFNKWTGYTGKYIWGTNMGNTSSTEIDSRSINDPLTKHTIMSAGSHDLVVGPALQLKSPFEGQYAMRIGIRRPYSEIDGLRYTFTVTEESPVFYYAFAVVLEDGGHGASNPGLHIKLKNALGLEIPCATYNVIAGRNIPGYTSVPYFKEYHPNLGYYQQPVFPKHWKNWTIVAVPLKDYIGLPVTAEFEVNDCLAGGHYAYAYIDGKCGPEQIIKSTKFLCKGQSTTITAPPGFKDYEWNTGETTAAITITTAGKYTCTVTTVTNCTSNLEVDILEAALPIPDFTTDQLCYGSTFRYIDKTTFATGDTAAVQEINWQFNDQGAKAGGIQVEHTFSDTGKYQVIMKVLSTNGCSNTLQKTVQYTNADSHMAIIASDTINSCDQAPVVIHANGPTGAVFSWNGPANFSTGIQNPTINTINSSQEGHYKVTVAVPDCPLKRDSVYVKVNPYPVWKTDIDTAICENNTGILLKALATGTDPIQYRWYHAATAGSLLSSTATYQTPALTDTTTYYITATDKGCTTPRKPVHIAVKPSPPIPSTNQFIHLCSGRDTVLRASTSQGTVQWYDDADNLLLLAQQDTFITPPIPQAKNYYTRSVLNGCYSANKLVFINPKPIPAAPTLSSASICVGADTVLTATSTSGTITWYPSTSSTAIPLITANSYHTPVLYADQDYYARVSDKGCSSIAAKTTVVVRPLPAAPVLAPVSACVNHDTLLSPIAADPISWYDAPVDGNLFHTGPSYRSPILRSNTTYYLSTIANSCQSARIAVPITVVANPSAPNPYHSLPVCIGSDVAFRITQVEPGTYIWRGPNGFYAAERSPIIPQVAVKDSGTYYVKIQNGSCVGEEVPMSLTIHAQEAAAIAFDKTAYCLTESTANASLIGTTNGLFYCQSDDLALNSSTGTINIRASKAGNYTIFYKTPGKCAATATATVQLTAIKKAEFSFNTTYCTADTLQFPFMGAGTTKGLFTVSPNGLQLDKNSGIINPQQSSPGNYTVVHTIAADGGCPSVSDSSLLNIIESPKAPSIQSNSPICEGNVLSLSIPQLNNWTIKWTGPSRLAANAANLTIANTKPAKNQGLYQVAYQNQQCIGLKSSTLVQINSLPLPLFTMHVSTPADSFINLPEIIFTNSSTNATSYNWNFGDASASNQVNPTHQFLIPKTYEIVLTAVSAAGCIDSTSQRITIAPEPIDSTHFLVPTVFSPNQDGNNDILQVQTKGLHRLQLTIYNRWGELIHSTNNEPLLWDGLMEGKQIPQGVYVYMARGYDKDELFQHQEGVVTIVY